MLPRQAGLSSCQVTKNPIGQGGPSHAGGVRCPGRFRRAHLTKAPLGISQGLADDERTRTARHPRPGESRRAGLIVRTGGRGRHHRGDRVRRCVASRPLGPIDAAVAQAIPRPHPAVREPDMACESAARSSTTTTAVVGSTTEPCSSPCATTCLSITRAGRPQSTLRPWVESCRCNEKCPLARALPTRRWNRKCGLPSAAH